MRFDKRLSYKILNRENGVSPEEFRRAYCEKAGIKLPEDSTSALARLWRSRSAPKPEDVRGYLTSLAREGHVERTGSNDYHRLSAGGRGYYFNVLRHE